jgi:hypothetical protein
VALVSSASKRKKEVGLLLLAQRVHPGAIAAHDDALVTAGQSDRPCAVGSGGGDRHCVVVVVVVVVYDDSLDTTGVGVEREEGIGRGL